VKQTTAWIGQDFDGWSVHSATDDVGPFGVVQGPEGVDLAVAMEWARRAAPFVVLTLPTGERLSAGAQTVEGLPPWTGPPPAPPGVPADRAHRAREANVRWLASASVFWLIDESREQVARLLLAALQAAPRVGRPTTSTNGQRIEIEFALRAPGLAEARVLTSGALTDAWLAASLPIAPGPEGLFDLPRVDLLPA
jgi:hypothetical protein